MYSCILWLRHPATPPPPTFGLIYEGAFGQHRQTTSLCNPLILGKHFNPSENRHFFANRKNIIMFAIGKVSGITYLRKMFRKTKSEMTDLDLGQDPVH
jgi:hypothetical protein